MTYKVAKILGKNEDYEKYHNLAVKALTNIRDEYFTPRGRCAFQTQTALSLAIIYDLQPEGKMDVSLGSLYILLYNNDCHLSTGFIGKQILCRALSKAGDNYDAVKTFLQKDYHTRSNFNVGKIEFFAARLIIEFSWNELFQPLCLRINL